METFTSLTPLLSVIAVVIGGVFSLVRWLDVRRREIKQLRWVDYSTQLALIGGSRPDGTKINAIEQAAALYQLLEFTEYGFITVRALEPIIASDNPLQKEWKDLNEPHLRDVLRILKSQKAYQKQVAKFSHRDT